MTHLQPERQSDPSDGSEWLMTETALPVTASDWMQKYERLDEQASAIVTMSAS